MATKKLKIGDKKMAETYIGEIRIFAGNYAPEFWAFCDGQILPIVGNEDLFSLLGAKYGGDGRTTFALPDFRGRIPVGMGAGIGLTNRYLGQKIGLETATVPSIPSHKHNFVGSTDDANSKAPSGKVLAKIVGGTYYEEIGGDVETLVTLNEDAVHSSGGAQSHTNMMPSLCMNYIIALKGYYPPRS